MSRRRHIARQYVWGCPTNSEPPDDDDDEEGEDDGTGCEPDHSCEHLDRDDMPYDDEADRAADRYERDIDRRRGA